MIRRFVVHSVLALSVAGCGVSASPIAGPVAVKGKAIMSGGKPVSGVAITLQPLEEGHMTMLEVKPDGTFSGEATPGTYAYFFGPSPKDKKGNGLKQIQAKYHAADLTRTVSVAAGQDLQIQLD